VSAFAAVDQKPPALDRSNPAASTRAPRGMLRLEAEEQPFVRIAVETGIADDSWTELVAGDIRPGDPASLQDLRHGLRPQDRPHPTMLSDPVKRPRSPDVPSRLGTGRRGEAECGRLRGRAPSARRKRRPAVVPSPVTSALTGKAPEVRTCSRSGSASRKPSADAYG